MRTLWFIVFMVVSGATWADSMDVSFGLSPDYVFLGNDVGELLGDTEKWNKPTDAITLYGGMTPFIMAEVQTIGPVREYSVEQRFRLRELAGFEASSVIWSNVSRVVLVGDGSYELEYIGAVEDETVGQKKPWFSALKFRVFHLWEEAIPYAELFPERVVLGLIALYGFGTILFRRLFLLKKFPPLENIRAIDEGQE